MATEPTGKIKQSLLNKKVLTLHEATLTFHDTKADGAPIVGSTLSPQFLWTGLLENRVRITEAWKVFTVRPTGSRFQKYRPLGRTWALAIDKPWGLPYPEMTDWEATRKPMVLDIVWRDEQTRDWHRNTFYNVTVRERVRDGEVEPAFAESQLFDAEYRIVSQGLAGIEVPLLPDTLPLFVEHVDEDGVVTLLYTYDPTAKSFSEVATGIATGKATIVETAGDLSVTFDGDEAPTLLVEAAGATLPGVTVGVPDRDDLPRLDFRVGGVRVASLSRASLYTTNLVSDAAPASGSDRFELRGGGVVRAALAKTGFTSNGVTA